MLLGLGRHPPPGNIGQCLEIVLVITAGQEVSCTWDDPKYPTMHRKPPLPNTHTIIIQHKMSTALRLRDPGAQEWLLNTGRKL